MTKEAFISTVILLLIPTIFRTSEGTPSQGCNPTNNEHLIRIYQTRFFMYKHTAQDFEDAAEACRNVKPKQKYQLATIASREEDMIVGKWLTSHLFKNQLSRARFWIGGKFDTATSTYRWVLKGNKTIEYHNLNEIYGDPIGTVDGCLALSFPFPKQDIYGYGYTWDVVPCDTEQFYICECTGTTAGSDSEDVYDRTRSFYEGIFPLGERRFTLTWDIMNYVDATTFCEQYNMTLYTPHNGDSCIFTFIKGHRPEVTKFHFWSTRPTSPLQNEPRYCPAAIYAYETHNECNCKWRYLVTAPADCNLKNAVICETPGEKDFLVNEETCSFDERLIKLDHANEIHRSDKKVNYLTAAATCRMASQQLVKFSQLTKVGFDEKTQSNFKYDKLSKYWVYNADIENCKAVEYASHDPNPSFKKIEANCTSDKHFFLCGDKQGALDDPAGRSSRKHSDGNSQKTKDDRSGPGGSRSKKKESSNDGEDNTIET